MRELWRLGGDSDDEDEFFGVISSILTDDEGRLYLLDAQLNTVKIFSPNGERTIEMANAVLDDKVWDTFDRRWAVGVDGRVYACTSYDDYAISVWNSGGKLDRVPRGATRRSLRWNSMTSC